MKLIDLKDAKTDLSAFVEESQSDRILITRRGRSASLVIGVESQDLELLLAGDVAFSRMLQDRRQRDVTLTSDDVRQSFGIEATAAQPTGSLPKRNRKGYRSSRRRTT